MPLTLLQIIAQDDARNAPFNPYAAGFIAAIVIISFIVSAISKAKGPKTKNPRSESDWQKILQNLPPNPNQNRRPQPSYRPPQPAYPQPQRPQAQTYRAPTNIFAQPKPRPAAPQPPRPNHPIRPPPPPLSRPKPIDNFAQTTSLPTTRSLDQLLAAHTLRNQMIMMEVLGKPVALRDQ